MSNLLKNIKIQCADCDSADATFENISADDLKQWCDDRNWSVMFMDDDTLLFLCPACQEEIQGEPMEALIALSIIFKSQSERDDI